MDNKKEYRCVTTAAGIRAYIGNAKVAAFDYETSPDDEYRDDDKAALDPAKSHICTMSISVRPGTGIEIPFAHKTGINISREEFTRFLEGFLTDTSIVKIAHNLSFESMFSYKYGIVIQEPVYDTIAASQMTLKTGTDFRRLQDSGLKKLSEELLHDVMPSFNVCRQAGFR